MTGTKGRSAPLTGEVVIRGRTRTVAARRGPRSVVTRRYAVPYDTDGPHVTLGVLWFAAAMGALAVGPVALVPLYAGAAGLAGFQVASAWRERGSGVVPVVAGVAGAAMAAGSAFGPGMLGLAIVGTVVVAVLAGVTRVRAGHSMLEAAGTIVQSSFPGAVAAAGMILTLRLEIGAAVTLLILVSAYECGDYLVGSGGSSPMEGPLSGAMAVAVASLPIAVLQVPPFEGAGVFVFAGFAAVLCPLGQLAASAAMPAAASPASALRRLDSLILLGPAWAFLIGLVLQQQAG